VCLHIFASPGPQPSPGGQHMEVQAKVLPRPSTARCSEHCPRMKATNRDREALALSSLGRLAARTAALRSGIRPAGRPGNQPGEQVLPSGLCNFQLEPSTGCVANSPVARSNLIYPRMSAGGS